MPLTTPIDNNLVYFIAIDRPYTPQHIHTHTHTYAHKMEHFDFRYAHNEHISCVMQLVGGIP